MDSENFIPKKVFIVPYRNRIQHKFFFSKYMSFILENDNDYEIFFSHQCDVRTFNRGATKNIGFLAVKNKYPDHYKDIDFIFNDVDTIPFNKIFTYSTQNGIVKHFYGFKYALGGIVVIKGRDFENINGFPCYWGWGMEDNVLQKRCDRAQLKIDRSVFYEIGSPEILQLFDGISRIINKKDPWRMSKDNGQDGLSSISNLKYELSSESLNPKDNTFAVKNDKFLYINILTFDTFNKFEGESYFHYDLREPKRKIINPDQIKETKKTVVTTEDWKKIPYLPTTLEKKEKQLESYYIKNVPPPPQLISEVNKLRIENEENDNFNKGINLFQQRITPPPVPTQVAQVPINQSFFHPKYASNTRPNQSYFNPNMKTRIANNAYFNARAKHLSRGKNI